MQRIANARDIWDGPGSGGQGTPVISPHAKESFLNTAIDTCTIPAVLGIYLMQ